MIELISEIINANILLSVTIYLYGLRRKNSMRSQIVLLNVKIFWFCIDKVMFIKNIKKKRLNVIHNFT